MTLRLRVAPIVFIAAGLAIAAQPPSADLLILNARVFTGVADAPWAEAIAIRGGRVVAVGTTADVRRQAGGTPRLIDAAGRLVVPGLNDAHTHPTAAPPHTALEGPPAFEQDPSLDDVIARVKSAVARAPAGGWIVGEIGGLVLDDPRATRQVLDPISGGRPVLLHAWHGHGAILNTEAMRRLRIGEQEPDPPGGFFARAPGGRTLTGLAHEYAVYTVAQRFAMLADRASQVREYQRFATEAASFGITSVQAMMTGYLAFDALPIVEAAALPIRVRLIDFSMGAIASWRAPGAAGRRGLVVASGAKWIIDGTPLERLMFLREPYSDAPSTRGRLNFPEPDVREFLSRAFAAGVQPMFHATGDAAIDMMLSALEATGGERWAPLRPRLEHGDMLEPSHFERARRLGVVLVQNPSHFMVPAIVRARVGDARMARTAAVKSAIEAGVPFALGSDGPINPYLNMMFAALNPANPGQALTPEQSLTAYTRGAAYAEMMEGQKGTIAPGMLADLAMLSQDLFKVPPAEWPKTVSMVTIVGGEVVHSSQ